MAVTHDRRSQEPVTGIAAGQRSMDVVVRDRIELSTSRFSGWQTARPKTIGSVRYGTVRSSHPLLGFLAGAPAPDPGPRELRPCVITPHAHSAPPFADPPGDTPDPVFPGGPGSLTGW